jgi:hypothetical protein
MNWSAFQSRASLRLAIRNCHQEKIPDSHPKGKDDLSCLDVLVGLFPVGWSSEIYFLTVFTLSGRFLAVRNFLLCGSADVAVSLPSHTQ